VTQRRRADPRLDIRLLGPPEVLVNGRPLRVDTRKAIAILALVAAEGRAFARDELAALLWPDSDDMAARGALRRTLSTMRAAIGDGPLVIDRSRVDIDRRMVRVDLDIVDAAMRSQDRPTLAAAAGLARGAFLAGFNLRDSPEFDDWRATRSVAAERAVLTVLDRLTVAAEADGDIPAAIAAASRRLDLDPLDERGHLRLMDLLVASGDRSAALRQYRVCVATLERELGVEPLVSTTARYVAIRDGSGADSTPSNAATTGSRGEAVPGHVPDPVPDPVAPPAFPLVGRAASLETLGVLRAAAGASGDGRVVALVGEAGIGKTRLATEFAAAVRADGGAVLATTAYPAERAIAYGPVVEWLRGAMALPDAADRLERLAPPTRAELARLLPAIEPHGWASPADGPGAHARLVGAIADGLTILLAGETPGVLVLDDVAWLDASTREALDFLVRRLAGRPIVLVVAWRAGDMDPDGQAFVDRLLAAPGAHRLELARLGRDEVATLVAATSDGAADPAVVDRLADASEGLPLYVVEALSAGHGAIPDALPTRVSTVLRGRLAVVGDPTIQVLVAASVIGRSFDVATVRHASGRTDEETIDALDEGVRRGLIREAPAGFDFVHGALRDLAYTDTSLARRRLLHRRVAEALRLDLGGSGREDLARLVLIADHERAAGRDAEAAEAYRQAGARAADVFANADAIAHDEAALALGHPDTAGLYVAIGDLRTRTGDYAGAIVALEAAAALARPDRLPRLEWALARVHLRRGDLVAADHHLEAAADTGPDDDALAARLWVDRSVIHRRRDDPTGAAMAARTALAAAERARDPVAAGAARRMLGLAALDAGDARGAIGELETALAAAGQDPDPTARIAAGIGLAMATARSGELTRALRYGDDALAECRRIGDRHLEAAVENHLADLLHDAGQDDAALEHLHRAVAAFAEVGGDPADPDPGIWMLSAS
jgi:DNA-binding SARP family transcriptional activator/tetratricopeptide (TPR) repeat protein